MQIDFMTIGLIIVYLASVTILLSVCDNAKTDKWYVPIKSICSAEFVLIAIVQAIKNGITRHFWILLAGLVLCLIGDVVLGFARTIISKRKRLVLCGMIAFFLAHIFFLILFYSVDPVLNIWLILLPALLFGLGIIIGYKLHFKLGRLRAPVLIYTVMIASIMVKAVWIGIDNPILPNIVLAIGGLMFFFSDSLESVMLFYHIKEYKNKLLVHIFNLVLYYLAVLCFILSLT